MQSIEVEQLSQVTGGIAGLLQAAGPILNGVASLIGAIKAPSGGQQQAAAPTGAPPSEPYDGRVSVTVRSGF